MWNSRPRRFFFGFPICHKMVRIAHPAFDPLASAWFWLTAES
jgi:hypothetical protein